MARMDHIRLKTVLLKIICSLVLKLIIDRVLNMANMVSVIVFAVCWTLQVAVL